jgi:hypothetical protein
MQQGALLQVILGEGKSVFTLTIFNIRGTNHDGIPDRGFQSSFWQRILHRDLNVDLQTVPLLW